MPKLDAIFEEHYIYNENLNLVKGKFDVFWSDCYGRFQIYPVRNGRVISYEVSDLYTFPESISFRSKKKAMQYVVAELFTELFDYEQYRIT